MEDFIVESLKYYDTNREKYEKLFQKAKYYNFKRSTSELEHNKIIFYDENRKECHVSRYEILGCYIPEVTLWIWGWAFGSAKNETVITKKILNYALDLDIVQLKSILVSSRFAIQDTVQLDIYCAIASYVSKVPCIYALTDQGNSIDDDDMYIIPDKVGPNDIIFYYYLLD